MNMTTLNTSNITGLVVQLIFSPCVQSPDQSHPMHTIIGYEPANLTVHPPQTVEGGFIFFV